MAGSDKEKEKCGRPFLPARPFRPLPPSTSNNKLRVEELVTRWEKMQHKIIMTRSDKQKEKDDHPFLPARLYPPLPPLTPNNKLRVEDLIDN